MTPETQGPSLVKLGAGEVEQELRTTREHLSRIPDDRLDWRPHEKSWAVGELGSHIANLVNWMGWTLEGDGFDLAESRPDREAPASTDEILEEFDRAREALKEAWDGVDDAALMEPWTLREGADEIFTLPKLMALRFFTVSHLIHHRGQLTVYLRMMDVPVPPTYGPSADEEPEWG